ncbi:MAG TPA: metallopeptidase TldD-related protein [Blastocatellia bacterium]|nr:metallopeptidase TldD-related protein [Blastocatellia bacterium]
MRLRAVVACIVLLAGGFPFEPPGTSAQQAEKSPLLKAMEEEMRRSMKGLGEKADPPPYFISYYVAEEEQTSIASSFGALRGSSTNTSRYLDVQVRVGDYKLDNMRQIRGDSFGAFLDFQPPVPITVENDPDAIKSVIWRETDRKYAAAVERLIQVKTDAAVKVKPEDGSPDFSRETPQQHLGALSHVRVDAAAWEKRLKQLSALFNQYPEVHECSVSLRASATNKYFVNSEESLIQHGLKHWRVGVYATTKADDGMELYRYEFFDAHSPEGLPDDKAISQAIDRVAKDLRDLRKAPAIDPYTGPAILTGRAAGVFFHEIFGHRIEGHRQKDEEEGQTFTKNVNQKVLPDFISVVDDPMMERAAGVDLNGHYRYDDEGVKAQPVPVVEKGVLKNFLMSRSPVAGFGKSNGHGRKQVGFNAVGRQGNLIVQAAQTVSESRLREMLIEECRKQGKQFGLVFKDISGGFTFTGRGNPQVFQVTPIMVYRVYTDGRPDELVRGVDLIGTPLMSFSKILACGDKQEVFNGYCGAESGIVPVSALAPSILTAQIEIQKKEKSADRPPLLPPPGRRSH